MAAAEEPGLKPAPQPEVAAPEPGPEPGPDSVAKAEPELSASTQNLKNEPMKISDLITGETSPTRCSREDQVQTLAVSSSSPIPLS